MASNGEWASGQDLLKHLPEALAQNAEVMKLLIADANLTGAQSEQILNECPAVLKKEYQQRKRQELLYELRECKDMLRQVEILEQLKALRG